MRARRHDNYDPVDVLISYSHRDEALKNELLKHLSQLKRQGVIRAWHDRDIEAGLDWYREIEVHLESAQIILLLISPDFLASDFCYNVEMKRSVERHDRGEACVIPVFLRPCDWKGAPFGKLQGLPTDAEAVTSARWSTADEAFAIVATGIRAAATNLYQRRLQCQTHSPGELFAWLKRLLEAKKRPSPEQALQEWTCPIEAQRAGDSQASRAVRITPKHQQLLLAYGVARATGRNRVTNKVTADAYIAACASSLAGLGAVTAVPCTAAGPDGSPVPLELILESHANQAGGLFPHPLADDAPEFTLRLQKTLDRVWRLAGKQAEKPFGTTVLWRLRSLDGRTGGLRALDTDTSWITAVAYRAFWHLRHDLKVDADVYVLCTLGDKNSVATVDDLARSIASVRHHHRSLFHPTLVVARPAVPGDQDVLDASAGWAAIRTVHSLSDLTAVRSHVAETAIEFLKHVATEYDQTPWLTGGRAVLLSDVHVPFHVWKDEWRSRESGSGSDSLADWRPADYDPASAEREVGPRLEVRRTQVRTAWTDFFSSRTSGVPLVVVGGPGYGKSCLLAWTAREMALDACSAIQSRSASVYDTSWPILSDLDTWTQQPGSPREALLRAMLTRTRLPENWSEAHKRSLELLCVARLHDHTQRTFLFLDALDQVRECALVTLQHHLKAMLEFGGRMVLSSREAALGSRQRLLPFQRATIVQAATLEPQETTQLAAKWLDATRARELDGHLRAHTALAVVAGSPLLLTLTCLLTSGRITQRLPETPASLYRELMHDLAGGAWCQTGAPLLPESDVAAFLADLRRMCWHLFTIDPHANRFVRESLVRAITTTTGATIIEANRYIATLAALGFVESTDRSDDFEPTYQFRHATLREFLVASYLSSEVNREGWELSTVPVVGGIRSIVTRTADLFERNAFSPAWEPVFQFAAGLLREPAPLLELLADSGKDDHFRHRLSLLCQCYGTLSADKENALELVMTPVLGRMATRGGRAIERNPHDWQQWLTDCSNLMTLPLSGSKVTASFIALYRDDKHHRLHLQSHDLLEILARAAGGLYWRHAADTLWKLAAAVLGGLHDIAAAARQVIEIADDRSEPGYATSLARIVADDNAAAWRRIPIAGALLGSRDESIVDSGLEYLATVLNDRGVESWLRNSAADALAHGLNGPRQTEIGELIMACFLSSDFRAGDLASQVLREVAGHEPSNVTVTLVYAVMLMGRLDVQFLSWSAKVLNEWRRAKLVADTVKYLWRLARAWKVDCYARVRAYRAIIEYGSGRDRTSAIRGLRGMLAKPVTDGRQHWLSIEALLEAGEDYEPDLRERALELAITAGVKHYWIVRVGELALQRSDSRLFEEITPILASIMSGERLDSRKEAPDWSERDGAAGLLRNSALWSDIQHEAFAKLCKNEESDWHSVGIVVCGASSSDLVTLTEKLLSVGKRNYRPWHRLLDELDMRGWRIQVGLDRRLKVLHRGQEEPRPDARMVW